MSLTKKTAIICTALAIIMNGGVLAYDTIYGAWTGNNITWTDANGNAATWVDGSIAYITALKSGEANPTFAEIKPYKVIFDTATYRPSFWANQSYNDAGKGRIRFGAGGVEFVKRAVFSCGSRTEYYSGVLLDTTQTWSGPATTRRCRSSSERVT